MRGRLGDEARVLHILEFIGEIESALDNIEFDGFVENHILRTAVVKWLENIGEAANHISADAMIKQNNIEWVKIIDFRNFVIHEYFGIRYEIIWVIATEYIKDLKPKIEKMASDLKVV